MIIHYEIAAVILIVAIMWNRILNKRLMDASDKMFHYAILVAFTSSFTNLISMYTISHAKEVPLAVNYMINSIYLLCVNLLPLICLMFFLTYLIPKRKIRFLNKIFFGVPYVYIVLCILANPFTGQIFYFDQNYVYTHGPGMGILYAISGYYVFCGWVYVIWFRKVLDKVKKYMIYFFILGNLLGIILQYFIDGLLIVGYFVAVSIVMVYVALQNPGENIDPWTGNYNKNYFARCLSNWIKEERTFSVICIEIDRLKVIQETLGQVNGSAILTQISEFFNSLSQQNGVFYLGNEQFALLLEDKQKTKPLIGKINSRFRKSFKVEDMEIMLPMFIGVVPFSDYVKTAEDVMDAIGYSMIQARAKGNNSIVYADEKVFQHKQRDIKVEVALKNAIEHHTLEVYYQPIYCVANKTFCTAEALVRLYDKELGEIEPEEFIPIAERNGSILKIGQFVFESVCAFIAENKLREKGIQYIGVNLSDIQCMQDHLAVDMLQIMREYQIPYDSIDFEIRESAQQTNGSFVQQMQQMMLEGVTFSMDNFGTGNASVNEMIQCPFRTIKIDKDLVGQMEENQKTACIMRNIINLFKDLNIALVVEGVENENQARQILNMGCDYIQGFYYAEPMNGEAYLQWIAQYANPS